MTVQELKEILEQMPQDYSVVVSTCQDIDDDTMLRWDTPIISIIQDEENQELCFEIQKGEYEQNN